MARVRGGGPPIGLEHALDFDTAETSAVHELAMPPQLTPPAEAPDGLGKLWGLYKAGTKVAEPRLKLPAVCTMQNHHKKREWVGSPPETKGG